MAIPAANTPDGSFHSRFAYSSTAGAKYSDAAADSNSVAVDDFTQRNNQGSALGALVTNTYNADSQVTNEAFTGGSRVYTLEMRVPSPRRAVAKRRGDEPVTGNDLRATVATPTTVTLRSRTP